MPTIRFQNDKRPAFQVERGTNLMQALLNAEVPVSSSCHGDGVCAKCRLEIIQGMSNLSEPNEIELDLKTRNKIAANFRISCQTNVLGDVVVDAAYW
jgi:2Fe-2S ferredoxin